MLGRLELGQTYALGRTLGTRLTRGTLVEAVDFDEDLGVLVQRPGSAASAYVHLVDLDAP